MRTMAGCGLLLGIFGCGLPAEDQPADSFHEAPDAIVFGAVDNGNAYPATVAYFNDGGKCTATVIAHSGNTGVALTAAHCIDIGTNGTIVAGVNHDTGVAYNVTDVEIHPDYFDKGPRFDVAMLTFSTSGLPAPAVVPAMAPTDGSVTTGQTVTVAGYGQTEDGSTNLRHHKDLSVAGLTSLLFVYDQSSGGVCFGDSGGPAYTSTASGMRVAGVSHAVGESGCLTTGSSVRVTEVYSTFIEPYMSGGAYGAPTCAQCYEATTASIQSQDGACHGAFEACFDSPDCDSYLSCLNFCSTQSCEDNCKATFPGGVALVEQIQSCVCNGACATECAKDPYCTGKSQCQYDGPNDVCNGCIDSNCCAESEACDADPGCSTCYPDCSGNTANDALLACAQQNCELGCMLPPPGEGGAGGGGGGGGSAGAPSSAGGSDGSSTGGSGGTTEIDPGDGATPADEGGCALGSATPKSPCTPWQALLALTLAGAAMRRSRRRGAR